MVLSSIFFVVSWFFFRGYLLESGFFHCFSFSSPSSEDSSCNDPSSAPALPDWTEPARPLINRVGSPPKPRLKNKMFKLILFSYLWWI